MITRGIHGKGSIIIITVYGKGSIIIYGKGSIIMIDHRSAVRGQLS